MHAEVVVDASVWVSSFRPEDVNHAASRFWAEQYNIKGGLLVAPMLLLIEVAAAISRRTGDPTLAKEAIKKLESASSMHTVHLVPIDTVLIQAAVEVATDLQLRAGDAIYVALAHQLNIPLVSWDREQLQRAESLVSTYTPDNYTFQEIHEEE
jgi:predicted nucleic acid-binding protein